MGWIEEVLEKYDRHTVPVDFSLHALNEKGLLPADLDRAVEAVRMGRIIPEKSDPLRRTVGFRLYDGKRNITYTVIAGLHENFFRVVTVIKEKGRM